jgi:ABC-type polysaccharide/polyol phosphate export permease
MIDAFGRLSAVGLARKQQPVVVRVTAGQRRGTFGLLAEGILEVVRERRLIRSLAAAEMRRTGANTFLGNVWWVVNPLLQVTVYLVLLSLFLGSRTPDQALFLLVAIVPWIWFAGSTQAAIGSVVARERLIRQAHFPRLVLPVSTQLAGLGHFAFGLVTILVVIVVFFPARLSPMVVYIPVIALVQCLLALAIGVGLSAVNVYVRDVGPLARHVFRLWFYVSPALWDLDAVRPELAAHHPLGLALVEANPMAVLLTAWRHALYGGTPPDLAALAVVGLGACVVLLVSIVVFKRLEPGFAKVL